MATFIKIRHTKNVLPNQEVLQWRILINNFEDLMEYIEATQRPELERFFKSPTPKQLDHEYSEMSMKKYISELVAGRKGISLVEGFMDVLSQKYKAMREQIKLGKELLVNSVGGWCYKENYFDINGCVIEKVHTNSGFSFPNDDDDEFKPIKKSKLFLENQWFYGSDDSRFYSESLLKEFKVEYDDDFFVIDNLRSRDNKWLLASIANSKDIYISTTGTDVEQIYSYIKGIREYGIKGKTFHFSIHNSHSKELFKKELENEKDNKVIFY